jgi:non-heme chloroperoxidase
MTTVTDREAAEVAAANASGRQPVVLIHGLWLLASSWTPWRAWLEDKGYAVVVADWPHEEPSVEAARAHPDAFAGLGVGEVTEHMVDVVSGLTRKPVVIGHSFGGLLAQQVAGNGLAAACVALDPAPMRGVLPLPYTAIRASLPVLGNPANLNRTVGLTFDQWVYAFANALEESEARALYDGQHVAAPAKPIFQAASANIDPRSPLAVDTRNPARGPLLVVTGEVDHIVPFAMTNATFKRQRKNPGVTEFLEIPGVGHSLVIDHHWTEVAEAAYGFLQRHGV